MTNYTAALLLGALFATGASAADQAAVRPAGLTKYQQANTGSSLSFTFTQLDAASTGRFKTFSTELRYNEADPAQGSLVVRVMIDSLDTQDAERDGTLKSADLFDTAKYPAATFAANTLVRGPSGGLGRSRGRGQAHYSWSQQGLAPAARAQAHRQRHGALRPDHHQAAGLRRRPG